MTVRKGVRRVGVTDKMQGLKLLYVTSKIYLLCLQKCGYGVVE